MTEKNKNSLTSIRFLQRSLFNMIAVVMVGLLIGIVMVGPFPGLAIAEEASPETLYVAIAADVDTYDPHAWISSAAFWVGSHIFDALITRDMGPLLATSWENPDKLTWLFHLREGVQFSNGEHFDASVVKYNLERYMDPETKAVFKGLLKPFESVEVIDKYTAKVKTSKPYADLLPVLANIQMISPKAVKELGKKFNRQPIGTGPYLLKEWLPMDRTVLEINPDYWGQKPKIKTIVWRVIPESSTRIVELTSGRAHIINKVPPEWAGELAKQDIDVMRQRSLWRIGIKLDITKPPFNNVKARQAINYAVDKESIIKNVLQGAGYMVTDHMGPGREGHDPNLTSYPYDPAKAKKLLAEAGYPDGVDITILTSIGRLLKDKEICEAISYQVKESGFNMKIVAHEWGMFLKTYRDFNGFILGVESPFTIEIFYNDADSRLKSYSWMGYHNEDLLKLMDLSTETFDLAERNKIIQKMNRLIYSEAPYLYTHYALDIYGVSKRLKGFTPREDSYIFLDKVTLD